MVRLSTLVSDLDAELVRLGYKGSTMLWYRGCWCRMERFFATGRTRLEADGGRIRACKGMPLPLRCGIAGACGGLYRIDRDGVAGWWERLRSVG